MIFLLYSIVYKYEVFKYTQNVIVVIGDNNRISV